MRTVDSDIAAVLLRDRGVEVTERRVFASTSTRPGGHDAIARIGSCSSVCSTPA